MNKQLAIEETNSQWTYEKMLNLTSSKENENISDSTFYPLICQTFWSLMLPEKCEEREHSYTAGEM